MIPIQYDDPHPCVSGACEAKLVLKCIPSRCTGIL